MRFGPTLCYSCPTCSKVFVISSITSCYNRIEDIYSDGSVKTLGPYRENKRISKCEQCNTIFWINKLKETSFPKLEPPDFSELRHKTIMDIKTGTYINEEIDIAWLNWTREKKKMEPVSLKFLNIDDYWRALQEGIPTNNEEEAYIRIKIWRAQNERIRNFKTITKNYFKSDNRWSENINSLIKILDNTKDEQNIMIAELYRNLGEFDLCKKTLEKINQPKMQRLKEFLLQQCELKYRWVISTKNALIIN